METEERHPETALEGENSTSLEHSSPRSSRGFIFDIKRDSSEDGPGIRTTVFFKGCPLSCVWCQNPEGADLAQDLTFEASRCKPASCDAQCVQACQRDALALVDGALEVRRDGCDLCGGCFAPCPNDALGLSGQWMELDDLLYKLRLDAPFYRSTGGGVTLSGGEVSSQASFAGSLLKALREESIHTAIETCGYFSYERFQRELLPHLDLIYFDFKLIDAEESRRYTGCANRLILENFRRLIAEAKIPVIPRIPLVPGVTATSANLEGIASFLRSCGVEAASLLSYNPMWHDKLEKIGKRARYARTTFMSDEELRESVDWFRRVSQPINPTCADLEGECDARCPEC